MFFSVNRLEPENRHILSDFFVPNKAGRWTVDTNEYQSVERKNYEGVFRKCRKVIFLKERSRKFGKPATQILKTSTHVQNMI